MTAPAAINLSDQIVASCVGLLLMPEVATDGDWRELVTAELHAALPGASATHAHMAELVREAPKAWPRGEAGVFASGSVIRARIAWVALTKWRLGLAVEHLHDERGKGAA